MVCTTANKPPLTILVLPLSRPLPRSKARPPEKTFLVSLSIWDQLCVFLSDRAIIPAIDLGSMLKRLIKATKTKQNCQVWLNVVSDPEHIKTGFELKETPYSLNQQKGLLFSKDGI